MDLVTVRLNEEESKVFKEYARLAGIPLSTLFKQTLEEKMEDELDLKAIQEYEKDGAAETLTHEEMKKELGL